MDNSARRLARAIDRVDDGPVVMVGVHNALAAQLAQQAGVTAGWLSGFEVSAAFGIADRNLLGSVEMVEVARRITVATDLSIVVDADNGYGSALAMRRAAREFAAVGVAGMCVEDSVFPKRNSFDPARDDALADQHEFADWIAATRQDLADTPFLLVGRTEALIAGRSVDTAIERARAYADAGADLIVVHSKDRTGKQAVEIATGWDRPTPLMTIPTAFPQLSVGELGALGYRVVVYANHLLRASVSGMHGALADLVDGNPTGLDARITSMQDIFRLTA